MAPFQQGENVVDHLAESHIPGRKMDNVTAWEGHSATRDTSTYPLSGARESGGIQDPQEWTICLTRGRLF